MNANISPWHAIRTRVTVVTLLVFVLSIWLISFYVSRTLQRDMQRVLGEQQFAAVSMVARDINNDLQGRLDALAIVAAELAATMPGGAAATQSALEHLPTFQHLFNAGSFVTGLDGTAVASVPVAAGRVGSNHLALEHVAMALQQGRTSISKPAIGPVPNKPLVSMAVPIRDPQGRVMGALVGVIDLGKPNFLDRIADGSLNKTGIVSLIASPHRMTVLSSNKGLATLALPPPGANTYLDRNIAGFEGYTVVVNVFGQEQLASIKQLPAAQWYLYSGLPTAEVFAPVRAMQEQMLLAAVGLSLLAGGLIWWLLNRQLAPLFDTVKRLARMEASDKAPEPLPVRRQDEVGELIAAFNRMLDTLGQRDAALKDSQQDLAITLNSIGDAVIATDASGLITRMNPTAERMTAWSLGDAMGQPLTAVFRIVNAGTRQPVPDPVQMVLAHGQVVGLANHTVLLAKDGQEYQIADSAAPIRNDGGDILGVVLVFSDVTEKYRTEQALQRSEDLFRETFRLMPAALTLQTSDGVLLDCSDEFCQATGIAREEAIGRNAQALNLWTDPQQRAALRETLARDGQVDGIEFQVNRRDGSTTTMQMSARFLNIAGQPLLLSFAHDISARKLAEARIRDTELLRQAEQASALEAQRQAARAALSLMEDAFTARQEAEAMSATLGAQLDELRRWQQLTLGRESRILAIKGEVNALLLEHGQAPRYPSVVNDGANPTSQDK